MTDFVIRQSLLSLVLNMLDRDAEKGLLARGEVADDIRRSVYKLDSVTYSSSPPPGYVNLTDLPLRGDNSAKALRTRELYMEQVHEEVATLALKTVYRNWDTRFQSKLLISILTGHGKGPLTDLEQRYDCLTDQRQPHSQERRADYLLSTYNDMLIKRLAADRRVLQLAGKELP